MVKAWIATVKEILEESVTQNGFAVSSPTPVPNLSDLLAHGFSDTYTGEGNHYGGALVRDHRN